MSERKYPIDDELEKYKPLVIKLSLGAAVGYSTGYVTRKLVKGATIVAGAGFMILQSLVYAGYIEIFWDKVADDAIKVIDSVKNKVADDAIKVIDSDGDGKITANDIKTYFEKFQTIITSKIPDVSGFYLGFLYGAGLR
eukprot:CAMPEP_0194145818 /NCGR_PEP_ID=MMETSP0152-20130528/18852_1 /TAXON_ID=1049557 /ORGANISM="Thalassiothrix antarctica, Strain L6-D1" /LENGTH=138 /DNA_ID=CAMNT_0038846165 /DNA_START=43 /DNA_END=459 /DNA_ORIENTATION=-